MTGPKKPASRRVLLGEITAARGIRGSVLIRTYTVEPAGIAAYGPLEDVRGRKRYTITVERLSAKGIIACIEGVTTRTQAERLKGQKLFVARERLPEIAAGEFYRADLVGLTAVDVTGATIGEVVGVENFGASDVLEIRLANSPATELAPMTESFVHRVDVQGGRIVVSMPVEFADNEPESES